MEQCESKCIAMMAIFWQCGEGEGECKNDEDCWPALICGDNNCDWTNSNNSFDQFSDCCSDTPLVCQGGSSCCSNKFDDDTQVSPNANKLKILRCSWFLLLTPQCGLGEGDCDEHYECLGDLVCGDNNCNLEFPGFIQVDDCCVELKNLVCQGGWDWECCSDKFEFGLKVSKELQVFDKLNHVALFPVWFGRGWLRLKWGVPRWFGLWCGQLWLAEQSIF